MCIYTVRVYVWMCLYFTGPLVWTFAKIRPKNTNISTKDTCWNRHEWKSVMIRIAPGEGTKRETICENGNSETYVADGEGWTRELCLAPGHAAPTRPLEAWGGLDHSDLYYSRYPQSLVHHVGNLTNINGSFWWLLRCSNISKLL